MKGYVPPWTLLSSHGVPYDVEIAGRTGIRWALDPWPLACGASGLEVAAPIVAFVDLVHYHGRRWRRPEWQEMTPDRLRDALYERLGIHDGVWPFSFATIAGLLRGAPTEPSGMWSRLVVRTVPHAVDIMKWAMLSGFPLACGFACGRLLDDAACWAAGEMLPPRPDEPITDGTCTVLAGWDDEKGAFACRSVHGPEWGHDGIGWIPYSYVTQPRWIHEVVAIVDL